VRFSFLALTSLAFAVLATPALGKVSRAGYLDDVQSYATCTVRNHHNSARELILANVDNKTMERRFADIYTHEALALVVSCPELVLRFRSIIIEPDAFRAAIADVLVNKDFRQGHIVNFEKVAPLVHLSAESNEDYQAKLIATKFTKKRSLIKQTHDQDVSRNWLSAYGECVVRKDPLLVREMLFSKPVSAEELVAISRIQPSLGACLVEGKELAFDRYTLRGSLATNYYRLAMADQTSSMGKAK
jgi:hypothetical protein